MRQQETSMRIAVAQMNVVLGDLAGNVRRIVEVAQHAEAEGTDILLTPELSLCGYPPEDLLLRPDFYRSVDLALIELTRQTADMAMAIVVGHLEQAGSHYYNAASVLFQGKRLCTYRKQHLPKYEVFDELRYFSPGHETVTFDYAGCRFGLAICEDIWFDGPARAAKAAGADVLLVLNASPYHLDKTVDRQTVLAQRVAETGMAMVYCNLVGGQDELVFDGGSSLMAADGKTVLQLPQFVATTAYADLDDTRMCCFTYNHTATT